ncbi:hypothetical protein EON79_02970, partial [bacterium]
ASESKVPLWDRQPAVESQGRIFLLGGSTLTVLASKDGKRIWRYPLPLLGGWDASQSYAGPYVGEKAVVLCRQEATQTSLLGLDRTTGRELWRVPWRLPSVSRKLILSDGHLLGLRGEETLVALNLQTGREAGAWKGDIPSSDFRRLFPSLAGRSFSLGACIVEDGRRMEFRQTPKGRPNDVLPWKGRYLAHYEVDRFIDNEHPGTNGVAFLAPSPGEETFHDLWGGRRLSFYDQTTDDGEHYGRLVGTDTDYAYLLHHAWRGGNLSVKVVRVREDGSSAGVAASGLDPNVDPILTAHGLYAVRGGELWLGKAKARLPAGGFQNVIAILPSGILSYGARSGSGVRLLLTPHPIDKR